MSIIEAVDLGKSYAGRACLYQINLSVPSGAIYGVVGTYGAGKTTLLKLLATLITPSTGDAIVNGYSLVGSPARIRRMVGYMPQRFGVYSYMSVEEYISFYADCQGVPTSERAALVNDLLQLVDLGHRRQDEVSRLTFAMKQRLSLARALTNDPQLLLLDEPFSGVDPRSQVEMRELIRELQNMGKTIVLTASASQNIAGLCTDIAILSRGELLVSGNAPGVQSLFHQHRTIAVRFFGNVDIATSAIKHNAGVQDIKVISHGLDVGPTSDQAEAPLPAIATVLKEIRASFTGSYGEASELLRLLMRSGVQVVSFNEEPETADALLIYPEGEADTPAAD